MHESDAFHTKHHRLCAKNDGFHTGGYQSVLNTISPPSIQESDSQDDVE